MTTPGSRSPLRLLMTRPPAGVSPMLVSTQRPSATAARLAPFPRCASTTRPLGGRGPGNPLELTEQVRVGQAVKAIAAKARRLGHRQRAADQGKTAMERGIEADHLRNVRPRADAGLDERDLVGQVIAAPAERAHAGRRSSPASPVARDRSAPPMHHTVHDAGEHPCDQVGVDLAEDAVNRGCRADADRLIPGRRVQVRRRA